MKHILYHENNSEHPYLPQEDAYAYSSEQGIFVVADGVTHDGTDPVNYPMPSDSYEVARIICNDVKNQLSNAPFTTQAIVDAYIKANDHVHAFNIKSSLYEKRKENGYSIGAATTASILIKNNKLLYGVLDDCFISVFSEDLVDHPMLKSFVDISAKYLDANYKWDDIETRRIWREDFRNHKLNIAKKEYGYGVIDGRPGFEQYIQTGEVTLKKNDLVCVYTDGFIPLMQNKEFIKNLYETTFSAETYTFIAETTKKLKLYKEKTCYLIKID